ncbi:MAG: hypothetical protein HYX84_01935 [Chloroflexi bacterium]|nr:hypothetical protein [Chloroflexota bacterium]
MTAELGKLEKPGAGQFQARRKIYLVPLLFSWEGAPAEYTEKLGVYWRQVGEHVANLETKIGKVAHIYHETVSQAGEEGLSALEKINPGASQMARERCQAGAELEAVEDADLVAESMDWERHLLMGFISEKATRVISDLFSQVSKKRCEYMAYRINETLKGSEAALLIIRQGHMVQFPPDIEVFSIAPPVLDEIYRWLRESPEKTE